MSTAIEFAAVSEELARRFTKFRTFDAWSQSNRDAFSAYTSSFIGMSIDVNLPDRSAVANVAVTSDMVDAAKVRMTSGEWKIEVR